MNSSNIIKTTHEVTNGIGPLNSINIYDPVISCFQPQIEQKSLQVSMESNRESLERKLQSRRTIPELVSQGIYPKLNTPLAFAEQCRQLEQAKARDLLQKKLKERPDRQCLVQHHILEDTHPSVDRSLQDKQRLLKKSKLQDNLNGLISQRPGPLDLVNKNILLLDENASMPEESTTDKEEQFFSDSSNGFGVLFSSSFDGLSFGSSFENVSPVSQAEEQNNQLSCGSFEFTSFDDNSQFVYNSLSSPEDFLSQPSPEQTGVENDCKRMGDRQQFISRQDIPPAPDITPLLIASAKQQQGFKNTILASTIPSSSTLTLGTLPDNLPLVTPASVASTASAYRQQKSQKKIRTKSISKPKQIKFHEYKGPPSISKSSQQSSFKFKQPQYEMLKLQQEQLMKWQVSPKINQSRNPTVSFIAPKPGNIKDHSMISLRQVKMLNMISSASPESVQKCNETENFQKSINITSTVPVVTCTNMVAIKPAGSTLRLEDMRVSELKAECKKFNISSSGSKPQLLERLYMYRNNLFNPPSDSNPPSVKSEFSSYNDICATTPAPFLDVEMNAASNLPPVYILESTEANVGALTSFQGSFPMTHSNNFINTTHNLCPNEIKSSSQQLQNLKMFNEIKKIEDDNETLSQEEKMKISELKIARLERELEVAQQEINMKNQMLMQLSLLMNNQAAASVPIQNAGIQLQQQHQQQRQPQHQPQQQHQLQHQPQQQHQQQHQPQHQAQQQHQQHQPQQQQHQPQQQQQPQHLKNTLENVLRLLLLQNSQQDASKIADIVKMIQAQQSNSCSNLSLNTLEQLLKFENASNQVNNQILYNIQQTLSQQVQHAILQNQHNPFSETGTLEVKSHQSPSFNKQFVGMRNSNSFTDLNNKNGINDPLFLSFDGQYRGQNQIKVDRNANQNFNQNIHNQSKSQLVGQINNHQQLPQHSVNNLTMEDLCDVLSTKPEFNDICMPLHEHVQMDAFHGATGPSSQGYDISFPHLMDSSEGDLNLDNISATNENMSHDSKMQTPHTFELMDMFNDDDITGSNYFFTPLGQNVTENHATFAQPTQNSMGSQVLNNHQRQGFKNGSLDMVNDFDLHLHMLQSSNCHMT